MNKQEMIAKLEEAKITYEVIRNGKLISAPKYPESIVEGDPKRQILESLGFTLGHSGGNWEVPKEKLPIVERDWTKKELDALNNLHTR